MMMNHLPDNRLNIPISQEWIDRLQDRAKQQGCSIAELIREAIAQYLAIETGDLGFSTRLIYFEAELKNLKHKIVQMELTKQQVTAMKARLGKLEQAIASSPSITVNTDWPAIALEESAEDDFEDEPDEVILDFLS